MSTRTKIVRITTGILLIAAILVPTLALLSGWANTWGATRFELQRALPGDELIAAGKGDWTHAITIDAQAEDVWPWIAQIGDDRAGFYSYTFIENLMTGDDVYHNANRILPQFQDPQPGEGLIGDSLRVYAVEPGSFLLARSTEGVNWAWLWLVEPVGPDQSRLLVRSRMRMPGAEGNPVAETVINLGAFVMERRMLDGIVRRAEGRTELAQIEVIEILLWVTALLSGLGAAALFLTRPGWQAPLLLGLAAMFALIWFTFWQPPVGLRLVFDLGLTGLVWREARTANASRSRVGAALEKPAPA